MRSTVEPGARTAVCMLNEGDREAWPSGLQDQAVFRPGDRVERGLPSNDGFVVTLRKQLATWTVKKRKKFLHWSHIGVAGQPRGREPTPHLQRPPASRSRELPEVGSGARGRDLVSRQRPRRLAGPSAATANGQAPC